jgi:hypothetical protein
LKRIYARDAVLSGERRTGEVDATFETRILQNYIDEVGITEVEG